ncbi:hypothetical protein NP233_g6197 [Leucocoprinus birnbaumii]|uniref:Uncharacterized protein n=1 Tax=Leucocoprinus birnbaumii TaxID=56174 RepID=A0AAD5VRF2_9AGAR|nr:hypothetical protein NP233_g6197 [Leucocoprinus birnbaumii]
MTQARWVVVDDADTSLINYDHSWFTEESGNQERVGTFGMTPYLQTLHGTNVNGSVSFSFSGTDVEAWGAVSEAFTTDDPHPDWECFVDGNSLAGVELLGHPVPSVAKRWCGTSGLLDGNHSFEIQVKVQSPSLNFYLDQIRYIPSPTLPLDNRTVLIENNDPGVDLDKGWFDGGELGNITSTNGSVAQVKFFGSAISWYGFLGRAQLNLSDAQVSWSMDDESPTSFLLKAPAQGATPSFMFDQHFFTTPDYPTGNHTLTVAFHGSDGSPIPLVLNYMYNKIGASTTRPGTPNATSHPNISEEKHKLGMILGVTLGGSVLVLAAAVYCYCFLKRRRERMIDSPFWVSSYGMIPAEFPPHRGPVAGAHEALHPPGPRNGLKMAWAPVQSRLARGRRKGEESVSVSQQQPGNTGSSGSSQPITKRSTMDPGIPSTSSAAELNPAGAANESEEPIQDDPPPEYTLE